MLDRRSSRTYTLGVMTARKGAEMTAEFVSLIARAKAAGDAAFQGATATPMIVGTPKNLIGSLTGGDGGGFDEAQPIYHVADGVCGFTWVTIHGLDGNSAFARFLKAHCRAHKGYYGGIETWDIGDASRRSQSYERKMKAASAFAAVLNEYAQANGLSWKAYSDGRLD